MKEQEVGRKTAENKNENNGNLKIEFNYIKELLEDLRLEQLETT